MLFPLDTIAAILFLLAVMDRSAQASTMPASSAIGLVALCTTFLCVVSLISHRSASRFIDRNTPGGAVRKSIAATLDTLLRVGVAAVYLFTLILLDWPQTLYAVSGQSPVSRLLQGLVGIAPYLLYSFAVWAPAYPLHTRATAGDWTFISFLLHRIRYRFFVLAFLIPSFLLYDLPLSALPEGISPFLLQIFGFLMLLITVWVFPAFLRFFWGCTRLPEGPLRDRVLDLQEKTGVRFSEILVWDLGGGAVLNAAAVGFIPPFRYLFLSKALVRQLTEDEIDGVICHEMGHIRYWHLPLYLILTIATMHSVQALVMMAPLTTYEAAVVIILCFALYFRFIFAFFSRRVERQADLYAFEVMETSEHLAGALERIGMLSGSVRWAPSWHHMSIAERVAFLRACEHHPELATAHHAALRQLISFGLVVAIGLLFWSTAGTASLPDHSSVSSGDSHQTASDPESHWKNVSDLLRDDATGPLRLAELYQNEGKPKQARRFAREALKRSPTPNQKKRANNILAQATPSSGDTETP